MSNNPGLIEPYMPQVNGPVRVHSERPEPCNFRFAKYPDGSRRLQGAYAWTEWTIGVEGDTTRGVVWKDIPSVDVDETGQEVPRV